jgi:hypothetical protein
MGFPVKDIQVKHEFTRESPFENPAPTWTEVEAAKIEGDGSERPSEETADATALDGRDFSGGRTTDFAYAIKKYSDEGAVFEQIIEADKEHKPIWWRETPLQEGLTPQVIGGRLGLAVSIQEDKQGSDGHHIHIVQMSGSEADPATIIQDDPNATGS